MMTNLTQKLDTLEGQLSTQNAAVIAAIGNNTDDVLAAITANTNTVSTDIAGLQTTSDSINVKLDTVIDKLDGILTALTTASGNIDAAPIVAAIEALRGPGPDNTIERTTNAIFGLAGPAPGRTLTDLYNLWNPGGGITPYNLLDALYLLTVDVKNNIGIPVGDATTTLLGLTYSIQRALTQNPGALTTLYSMVRAITVGLTTPESIDYTVLAELDALRLAQLAAAGAAELPAASCADPLESNGLLRFNLPGYATPATVATFDPATLPYGITTPDGIDLTASDWANYSVYVASRSTLYGTDALSSNRYSANKLRVFAGGGAKRFYVDGDVGLAVRICPLGTAPTGYIWLSSEVEAVSTSNGIRYLPITTKYSDLTFITVGGNPRVLSGSWANWRWRITGAGPQAVWGVDNLTQVSNTAEGTIDIGNILVLQSYIEAVQIELLPPL